MLCWPASKEEYGYLLKALSGPGHEIDQSSPIPVAGSVQGLPSRLAHCDEARPRRYYAVISARRTVPRTETEWFAKTETMKKMLVE
jgi:hypothetical protein